MENRRRRTGYYNNGGSEESRRRSMRNKPPPPRASWQPTVPYWEKKFCKVVCALDWDTILDRKRFVHLYDNVVNWNDSAGEEAFHNAKKRFLAQMHGWPCEISLPSPDLYIDEVDWDAQVDLQPLLELEHESLVPNKPETHDEPVIIFGDTLICNLGLSPAGWGDEDENFKKATNKSSWNNHDSSWEQKQYRIEETTMENEHVGSDHNAKPVDVDKVDVDKRREVLVDTGWRDGWLDTEGTENNGVPYETSYGSSRFTNNSNNFNKEGRYKWRSGSNGKKEMMV